MEIGPQQFGKWLIAIGGIIVLTGVLLVALGKMGLFRLPGDLQFGSKNWRVFIPLGSCILISLVLTLIFWLIGYFRR